MTVLMFSGVGRAGGRPLRASAKGLDPTGQQEFIGILRAMPWRRRDRKWTGGGGTEAQARQPDVARQEASRHFSRDARCTILSSAPKRYLRTAPAKCRYGATRSYFDRARWEDRSYRSRHRKRSMHASIGSSFTSGRSSNSNNLHNRSPRRVTTRGADERGIAIFDARRRIRSSRGSGRWRCRRRGARRPRFRARHPSRRCDRSRSCR